MALPNTSGKQVYYSFIDPDNVSVVAEMSTANQSERCRQASCSSQDSSLGFSQQRRQLDITDFSHVDEDYSRRIQVATLESPSMPVITVCTRHRALDIFNLDNCIHLFNSPTTKVTKAAKTSTQAFVSFAV